MSRDSLENDNRMLVDPSPEWLAYIARDPSKILGGHSSSAYAGRPHKVLVSDEPYLDPYKNLTSVESKKWLRAATRNLLKNDNLFYDLFEKWGGYAARYKKEEKKMKFEFLSCRKLRCQIVDLQKRVDCLESQIVTCVFCGCLLDKRSCHVEETVRHRMRFPFLLGSPPESYVQKEYFCQTHKPRAKSKKKK